jgi:protein-S-isoprenylcysteine O-methyltransferase Ste14
MDQARYVIAVMMAVMLFPAIASWYVIHPFARFWRRLGTVASFSIIYSVLISGCVLLWEARATLIGRDLGFQPWLMPLALPAGIVGLGIARARRRLLTQRILVGVPEVSNTDKGALITTGIYGRVRNPRYLEFLLLSFVYVAFANYAGVWMIYALTFPAIHLVVLLEEPELRQRFGAEYEEYCRRVPRYLPTRSPRGQSRI